MKKSAQVFIACALFSFSAFCAPNIQDIQNKATQQKLWTDPFWIKLMHYQKKTFGGYESQVDAQNYFLSSKGRDNPQSELLKNIEVLFTEQKTETTKDQPHCKFPLRYKWLREKLLIDAPDVDSLDCQDFQLWKSTLGANGISLIFASSYTNNPASMFGHTFLRLHRVQKGIQIPDMLHYTVNFAAETGSEHGLLYTVKGLFGYYPGLFSTFPYYIKIRQYNNFESRDLWEYKLNLSKEQLEKVILHLWEMGSAYFAYYFADENCSYFLLSLLEITDDNLELRKDLPFFTIPVDTLKIVKKETPWIVDTHYRPSLRKRYEASFGQFSDHEKNAFKNLVEKKDANELKSFSQESQARILDTAVDFVAMKEKELTKTDFQKKLLDLRSEIPATYEKPQIEKPGDPLLSHPTVRMGLGGSRIGGVNFAHLDFRGAYHDLLDNPKGFDPAAQIQSMEGRIRISLDNRDVSLDHLKMIEVVSLNPITQFLSKSSWNVGFGWRKNYSDVCFDCGSFYLEGGPGFTFGNSTGKRIYWTTFANGFFQAGPWNRTDYQVGPSGTSTLLVDFTRYLSFMLSGNVRYSPWGEPNFIYKGSAETSLGLTDALSLRGWANVYSESHEFGGSLLYYF